MKCIFEADTVVQCGQTQWHSVGSLKIVHRSRRARFAFFFLSRIFRILGRKENDNWHTTWTVYVDQIAICQSCGVQAVIKEY